MLKARREIILTITILFIAASASCTLMSCRRSADSGGVPLSPPAASSTRLKASEAEPNTEHYADYGANWMTNTDQDPLSTFAVDVDTASYSISRRKLTEGELPPE